MNEKIADSWTSENGKSLALTRGGVFHFVPLFLSTVLLSLISSVALASDDAVANAATSRGSVQTKEEQKTRPRRHLTLIGGGGAFGIIYPREINDHLHQWMRAQGEVSAVEEVYTDMIFSYVPRFSMSYSPVEYVALEMFAEFGWAFKVLAGESGEKDVFHFVRFSPGLNVMVHLPVNGGENTFFAGPGIEFDMLRFEQYRANTTGFRGTVGYRFYEKRLVADIFGAVLVSRAESNVINDATMELNYTSFLFGATIYGYLYGQ